MQTSVDDKCLSNEFSQKDLVRNHDYPEFESYALEETCQLTKENDSYKDEYEDEASDEFEESQSETVPTNVHDQSRNVRGKNARFRFDGRVRILF